MRISGFIIWLLLQAFLSTGLGQEMGIYRPGDVLFEKPLDKFGLPGFHDNFVIFQDSKGFIWFGHKDGLFRYDGYELKEFLKTPVSNDDLSSTLTRVMAEDEFGYIWVGCYRKGGLFRYDPRTEKFLRFPRPGKDPETIDDTEIWSVLPDKKGNVWIGTTGYGGGYPLFKYSYETDSFKEYLQDTTDANSIPTHQIYTSYMDEFSNIWFGTENGLIHFNPATEKFTFYELHNKGGDPIPIRTFDIKEDGKGNLWLFNNPVSRDSNDWFLVRISDSRDLLESKSDRQKGYFKDYKIFRFNHRVLEFDFDLEGNIWLSSNGNGLIRFDTGKETWKLYRPDSENQFSISTNIGFINGLFCDASGEIWFGTGGGIQKYSHTKQKFTLFDHNFFGLSGEEGLSINSVYEDPKGILWIAYDKGLIKFDPLSGEIQEFKPNPGKGKKFYENIIRHILPGENGNLYCFGSSAFYIFDVYKETFSEYPWWFPWTDQKVIVWPFSMIQDRNGIIWLGSNPYCYKIDPLKEKLELPWFEKNSVSYNNGIVFALYQDDKERIWLGTEFGLNVLYPGIDSILPIKHDPMNPEGLSVPQISAILQDTKGNMWIGTRSNGLSYLDANYLEEICLNSDSLKFKHYSKSNGLPDLHIRGLIEDNNGNIWIATYNSIARFNPHINTFTSFSETDGIHVDRFERNFTRNPATGRIYLGGITGLISFHPDSIPVNTFVPPIVLTGVKLNNAPVPISDTTALKQSITYTDHLDLSNKENFLEFEFAALDFVNPEKNQYKYIMIGVDPDTIDSGTKRTAEYRDLKPGEYTFWVTGSNNDGLWNPYGINLSIKIHPPWYRSLAAFIGYGVFIILAIIGFIRLQTYRLRKDRERLIREVDLRTVELKKKNEKIRELDKLKTRFFSDISHEIRTPLTLILGPIDNLMNEHEDSNRKKEWLSLIKRNGQRLMQLIDQLLDISKLDSGKMRLIMTKEDIIQYLRMLFHEYSFVALGQNIHYIVEIPDTEYITWYDSDKLTKIIGNLLSNAFKFTLKDGTITCRVRINIW